MNIYADAGLLILGTRMKRISDRFLSEVSKIYKERKIGFEPVWFPVFLPVGYERPDVADRDSQRTGSKPFGHQSNDCSAGEEEAGGDGSERCRRPGKS